MPHGIHPAAFDPLPLLLTVGLFAVALLVPALLSRFISPQRPSDPDGRGGDGGGGAPPPTPPKPRPSGLPLAVSQPARIRLRDARPLARRLPARRRRVAREPTRTPVRQV